MGGVVDVEDASGLGGVQGCLRVVVLGCRSLGFCLSGLFLLLDGCRFFGGRLLFFGVAGGFLGEGRCERHRFDFYLFGCRRCVFHGGGFRFGCLLFGLGFLRFRFYRLFCLLLGGLSQFFFYSALFLVAGGGLQFLCLDRLRFGAVFGRCRLLGGCGFYFNGFLFGGCGFFRLGGYGELGGVDEEVVFFVVDCFEGDGVGAFFAGVGVPLGFGVGAAVAEGAVEGCESSSGGVEGEVACEGVGFVGEVEVVQVGSFCGGASGEVVGEPGVVGVGFPVESGEGYVVGCAGCGVGLVGVAGGVDGGNDRREVLHALGGVEGVEFCAHAGEDTADASRGLTCVG